MKNKRICKFCKGIIDLNNHNYYVSRCGKRKKYICRNCMHCYMGEQYNTEYSEFKDLLDRFIKSDFNLIINK